MRTKTLGKFKLDSSTAVWPWWAHSREISLLRTGDSEWQVSQRAVWNSLLGSKYHVYQSCQHPLPSFAHLQMTSSWIWFPSLSLSLDKQGRKGVIYCIYLCIYLFIWHTARKSIPPLPSWQGFREGAGGCVGAEAPEWLHTTPQLFPGTEKRFPSTGFPYCSAGRNRAGHALSRPDLIWDRSHRCTAQIRDGCGEPGFGSLQQDAWEPWFSHTLQHLLSPSHLFSSLWSKRDRAPAFIPLLGFRPWRIYDHWVMIIQNLIQSQRPLLLSALFKKCFQPEPDPGEEKWYNQYQGRIWNCLAGKKIISVRIT